MMVESMKEGGGEELKLNCVFNLVGIEGCERKDSARETQTSVANRPLESNKS